MDDYFKWGNYVNPGTYQTMAIRPIYQSPKMFRASAIEIEDQGPVWADGITRTYGYYPDYGNTGFYLYHSPISLRGFERAQFYIGALNKNQAKKQIYGNATFAISDINYQVAYKDFVFTPDRPGDVLEGPVSLWLNEFVAPSNFDWGNVWLTGIAIAITLGSPGYWGWDPDGWGGYKIWLDGGPFYYKQPVSYMTDFASFEGSDLTKDLGRRITVTSPTGYVTTNPTPFRLSMPQNNGDKYKISADNSTGRFQHWVTPTGQIGQAIFDYIPASDAALNAIYKSLVTAKLTIEAKDENGVVLYKTMKLGSLSPQKTPFSYVVNAGTYTVQIMDATGFISWSDGDTQTTKSVTVGSSAISLTAIYTAGTDPGTKTNLTTIAIAGAIAASLGLGGYYIYKRSKRKVTQG